MARWLLAVSGLQIVTVVAFALAGDFWLAAAAYMAASALRRLHYPISLTWINQGIHDSKVRATVLSMSSQLDALGQIFGGPAMGAVATLSNLRAALAGMAGLGDGAAGAGGGVARRRSAGCACRRRQPDPAGPVRVGFRQKGTHPSSPAGRPTPLCQF